MARKKTVTSWKSKKNYSILAPEMFDRKEIGVTIASDPKNLEGRTLGTTLGSLLNDRGKNYLNLIFEVHEVKGDKAFTRFKKFFIPTGYLRSKVRKRTNKIDYMQEVEIEGQTVLVKIMVLSRNKVSDVQKSQIKSQINSVVSEHNNDKLDHLVQQTLFGKFGTEIYKKIKSVCPIMRVEVYQMEMLS